MPFGSSVEAAAVSVEASAAEVAATQAASTARKALLKNILKIAGKSAPYLLPGAATPAEQDYLNFADMESNLGTIFSGIVNDFDSLWDSATNSSVG